jgi:hypothetical protein
MSLSSDSLVHFYLNMREEYSGAYFGQEAPELVEDDHLLEQNDTRINWRKDPEKAAESIRNWLGKQTLAWEDWQTKVANGQIDQNAPIPTSAIIIQQINSLNFENTSPASKKTFTFTLLPQEICLLKALESLNLSQRHIEILPDTFGDLSKLKALKLNHNPRIAFPLCFNNLTALQDLELNYCSLRHIPPIIWEHSNLESLSLNHNQIKKLPDDQCRFPSKLRALSLDHNRIKQLPDSIGKLSTLETLSLHYNEIEELLPTIGKLSRLSKLFLRTNHLTTLPDELGSLTSLARLDISNNKLMKLPRALKNLTLLVDFNISYNRLITIPKEIADLQRVNITFCPNSNFCLLDGLFNPIPYIKSDLTSFRLSWNYICQTPLASLCQSILRDDNDQTLQDRFSQLSPADQDLIKAQASDVPPEALSQDRFHLNAALLKALKKKYNLLDLDERNAFWARICHLDSQHFEFTLSDSSYLDRQVSRGITIAPDNFIRMVDALALVS